MNPAQMPPGISTGDERMAQILKNLIDHIVERWFKLVRSTMHMPLTDAELKQWLTAYSLAFFEQLHQSSSSSTGKVLFDWVCDLRRLGVSPAVGIDILALFSKVLDSFEDLGFQAYSSFCIKDQVLHGMLHNVSDLMSWFVKENLRQQERTSTLLRVAKAAGSSLDLKKVIRIISDEVVQSLDAQVCNSFLFPSNSQQGNYFLIDPLPPAEYLVPDPPESFGMKALLRQEPVICYDAALDPLTDKESVRFFNLKSLMAFPLVSNGKSIAAGLIVMKDYHHFTRDEIDLVMGIANATAIAIENAQMIEKIKQMAIIEERNRLSMEIHDNLAQALAIIKMDASTLLHEDMRGTAHTALQEIRDLADEAYIDLRDTIFGLRAINESDTHFLDNFKSYLAIFGMRSKLDIQFDMFEEHLNELSNDVVLQLGRILEEALKNIRKHAMAKHVWLKSGKGERGIWITVEDDGIGIDTKSNSAWNSDHVGLRIMRERAESVGGKCTIGSNDDGRGTVVSLEFPLRQLNEV